MKIPSRAKKVFSGVLFDVYHWPQKLYDGSTKTFEMLRRRPSVHTLATVGKKIMILDQEQPGRPLYPSLPAGQVDKGEKPTVAAKRELLEETGYKPGSFKQRAVYGGNSKVEFIEHSFIARNCKKVCSPDPGPGEIISLKLVNFDEFLQTARQPSFAIPEELRQEMYEALLDKKKYHKLKKEIFG